MINVSDFLSKARQAHKYTSRTPKPGGGYMYSYEREIAAAHVSGSYSEDMDARLRALDAAAAKKELADAAVRRENDTERYARSAERKNRRSAAKLPLFDQAGVLDQVIPTATANSQKQMIVGRVEGLKERLGRLYAIHSAQAQAYRSIVGDADPAMLAEGDAFVKRNQHGPTFEADYWHTKAKALGLHDLIREIEEEIRDPREKPLDPTDQPTFGDPNAVKRYQTLGQGRSIGRVPRPRIKKSRTVADLLMKARKVHKYTSKHKDKSGSWVYDYAGTTTKASAIRSALVRDAATHMADWNYKALLHAKGTPHPDAIDPDLGVIVYEPTNGHMALESVLHEFHTDESRRLVAKYYSGLTERGRGTLIKEVEKEAAQHLRILQMGAPRSRKSVWPSRDGLQKSQGNTAMSVRTILAKAGGHKYLARHKNPSGGWIYEYANHVSAVHHADPTAKITKEKLIAILEDAAEDIGHLHQHERDASSAAMQQQYSWTASDLRHVRHATIPKLRKLLEQEYASKQAVADKYDGVAGAVYGDQLRAAANVTRKMINALSHPTAEMTDKGLRHHTAPQRRHEAFQLSQAQARWPIDKLPAMMQSWSDATLRDNWHEVSKTYHTDASFAMMDEMSRRASLPKPTAPDPGALAGPLAQTRMEFSLAASPTSDFLRKARQGEMKQGHKYTSRHKNDKGEWEYVYASGIGHATGQADGAHQLDLFGEEHAVAQGGDHGELPPPSKIRKPEPKPAKVAPPASSVNAANFIIVMPKVKLTPALAKKTAEEHHGRDSFKRFVAVNDHEGWALVNEAESGGDPGDKWAYIASFDSADLADYRASLPRGDLDVTISSSEPKPAKAKAEPETFKHGYMDYTSKEIDQMVGLIEHLAGGPTVAIDRRKFTEPVLRYALSRGLLSDQPWKSGEWREHYNKYMLPKGKLYPGDLPANFVSEDLPVEATWRLFDKHILKGRQKAGKGIASEPGWLEMGIYPAGDRFDNESAKQERERMILRLARHGFFIFQSSGEIWDLQVDKRTRERHGITTKSAAGTVADVLSKARKGDQQAGHKYEARTWNNAAGHWDYHYRTKDDPKNLSADHIFAIFNNNKGAALRNISPYIEWAGKEGSKEQAGLINRLDATTYGMGWALQTGRLPGTIAKYLRDLQGKELAKVIAAVLPHVNVSGDVPAVLAKMWGSPEKQDEIMAQLREYDYGRIKALKAILK